MHFGTSTGTATGIAFSTMTYVVSFSLCRFWFDLFEQIQGTGSVVLSGFINAARLSSAASGRSLSDHRVLFFGAGSAGIGVAKQLLSFFTALGMSPEEARSRIYVSAIISRVTRRRSVCSSVIMPDRGLQGIDHD